MSVWSYPYVSKFLLNDYQIPKSCIREYGTYVPCDLCPMQNPRGTCVRGTNVSTPFHTAQMLPTLTLTLHALTNLYHTDRNKSMSLTWHSIKDQFKTLRSITAQTHYAFTSNEPYALALARFSRCGSLVWRILNTARMISNISWHGAKGRTQENVLSRHAYV